MKHVEITLEQGYAIEVLDTPGLDSEENGDVKQYLFKIFHRLSVGKILMAVISFADSYGLHRHREQRSIAGIIYMHDISQRRINKSVLDSFEWLLAVCGLRAMQNVVIVTTMWDSANTNSAGRHSELEGREMELQKSDCCYREAFSSGASLRRHNNTSECALAILQLVAHKQPVTLQCQSSHPKDAASGNSRAGRGDGILGKLRKLKQSKGVSAAGIGHK